MKIFGKYIGKYHSIIILLLAICLIAPPSFAQMQDSDDEPDFVRITNIKCMEMKHPTTGEAGMAVALEGTVYDRSGDTIVIYMYSKTIDPPYMGQPFYIYPKSNSSTFIAAIFIPLRELRLVPPEKTQIHFRSIKTGRLVAVIKSRNNDYQ